MKESIHYQHIILVDDDDDDRDIFAEAIHAVAPTVQLTMRANGEDLLEYLHTASVLPQAVFLDLNMPRKNGKECLRDLRGSPSCATIPVIVYTTSLNPLDIEEAYQSGANFFVRKPNSFADLKAMLYKVLTTPASPRPEIDHFVLHSSLREPG